MTAVRQKTVNTNKTKTTTTVEIQNTPYWLNVKTPVGVIGTRLATGIKQHETLLALIDKYGVEKTNRWLETKDFDGYIAEEGKSTKLDDLDAEFANL